MDEVTQICDRVLVMRNGKIIADDAPDKLASTISISHLHLLMDNNNDKDKAIEFAKNQNLVCKIHDKWIEIEIHEHKIADFLIGLAQIGVHYIQIYIDIPTLQDYFLQVAKKNE